MRVALFQLDGKLPNLAIMAIAAHHRARGDEVELRHVRRPENVERDLFDQPDMVYASAIFERSMPYVRKGLALWFQRWCIRRADKMISWEEFKRAQGRPEKCGPRDQRLALPLFVE